VKLTRALSRECGWISRSCAGGLAILLGGCALMRQDTPPLAVQPASQIALARDIGLARDGWPQAHWWGLYGDPQLDGLVDIALKQAPTMVVARARVDAARAQAKLVDASTGLLVELMATLNRESVSENGFLGPFAHTNPALGTTGPWYTAGTAGLGAEYSVDLWGKDRSRVDAALGLSNARAAEAAHTELLVSSQVVHVYYDIQAQHAAIRLLEQARDIELEAVAAHRARAQRGLEARTRGEIALAHQLELDRQIAAAQSRIRKLREALRALVGAGSDDLPDIAAKPLPATAGRLPASLGYELLARRPDLQAMRWTVQASLSQVDVAKAAFYPSFDIRAFVGFDALHLDDLLHRSSRQLNLIPGLTLPLFDSGRLNANLASARSQSNLLIAQYNEAIVNAVREVAHASIELEGLQREMALQDGKLASAEFAFGSADAQYRRGLVDSVAAKQAKLPVLLEQGKVLTLRTGEIHAQAALITALGGGYGPDAADAVASTVR